MTANGWSIDTATAVGSMKRKLFLARECVSDECPVDQVIAFINRNPWKILKATTYQILLVIEAANTRIRAKSADYRIFIGSF